MNHPSRRDLYGILQHQWIELNEVIVGMCDMYFLTNGISRDGNEVFTKKFLEEKICGLLEDRLEVEKELAKYEDE
tara:strand:+ start:647 stop:871 length:225 start_codon:yes stop_codon:yes gene_type:complete